MRASWTKLRWKHLKQRSGSWPDEETLYCNTSGRCHGCRDRADLLLHDRDLAVGGGRHCSTQVEGLPVDVADESDAGHERDGTAIAERCLHGELQGVVGFDERVGVVHAGSEYGRERS